jgi:hypothetical protein
MNESIKEYLSNIGRIGGSSCGGKKAEASRKNGKLGGRPKKNTHIKQEKPSREKNE